MKKAKRKNNIGILWIIYILLLIVCIVLSNVTKGDIASSVINGDIASAAINAALFVIVCIIFGCASKNLIKVNKITKALDDASSKIQKDYVVKQVMLLEDYRKDKSNTIFSGTFFDEIFASYLYEVDRLDLDDNTLLSSCDINDYVNKETVDSAAHKNMLNLITGVMTGLGILGTFIGLTIGLQNFTTGSAEQIEESIPRLMDGIKVAFHTSIYGMTFSLVFNYIYKQIMEQAYNALDDFIVNFNKYVCADVDNDSNNFLYMSLKRLPESIGAEIGKQINASLVGTLEMIDKRLKLQSENMDKRYEAIIVPQMNKMNESLVKLADNIREDQDETIKKLITLFTEQMNDTLGQSFSELRKVIEETAQIQRQNNEFAEKVLPLIGNINESTERIHELSQNTIEGMSGYVDSINALQNVINENFMEVGIQLSDQAEINELLKAQIENLVGYEKQFADASEKFTIDIANGIESLGEFERTIKENAENSIKLLNDSTKSNSEMMAKAVEECTQNITRECSDSMMGLVALAGEEMTKLSSTVEDCTKNISNECSNSMNELTATVKKEVENISGITDKASERLEKATSELTAALENSNKNVVNSFEKCISEFDSIVSEICKQLSATIAEVDAVTGKVPKVVDGAYRGIEEGFSKLRGNIEGLINSVDDMRRTVQEWNDENKM